MPFCCKVQNLKQKILHFFKQIVNFYIFGFAVWLLYSLFIYFSSFYLTFLYNFILPFLLKNLHSRQKGCLFYILHLLFLKYFYFYVKMLLFFAKNGNKNMEFANFKIYFFNLKNKLKHFYKTTFIFFCNIFFQNVTFFKNVALLCHENINFKYFRINLPFSLKMLAFL